MFSITEMAVALFHSTFYGAYTDYHDIHTHTYPFLFQTNLFHCAIRSHMITERGGNALCTLSSFLCVNSNCVNYLCLVASTDIIDHSKL